MRKFAWIREWLNGRVVQFYDKMLAWRLSRWSQLSQFLREISPFRRAPKAAKAFEPSRPSIEILEERFMPSANQLPAIGAFDLWSPPTASAPMGAGDPGGHPLGYYVGQAVYGLDPIQLPSGDLTQQDFVPYSQIDLLSGAFVLTEGIYGGPYFGAFGTPNPYSNTVTTNSSTLSSTLTMDSYYDDDGNYDISEEFTLNYNTGSASGTASYSLFETQNAGTGVTTFVFAMNMSNQAALTVDGPGGYVTTIAAGDQYSLSQSFTAVSTYEGSYFTSFNESISASASYTSTGTGTYQVNLDSPYNYTVAGSESASGGGSMSLQFSATSATSIETGTQSQWQRLNYGGSWIWGWASTTGPLTESGFTASGDGGTETLTSSATDEITGSASGWASGSNLWIYSGSGSYTDSSAAGEINVVGPGSDTLQPAADVRVTTNLDAQSASGYSGSWSAQLYETGWSYSGSGSAYASESNSSWYSGSGSFGVYGATGYGNFQESGSQQTYQSASSRYLLTNALDNPVWSLQGGSASGWASGSSFYSYSASVLQYEDESASNGVDFFLPDSLSTTITPNVSVTLTASGSMSGSLSDSWSAGENASGNWSYSGGGSISTSQNGSGSYSGSGTFTATGGMDGSGWIAESGNESQNSTSSTTYSLSGSTNSWVFQGIAAAGAASGSNAWSYSGSGNFSEYVYESASALGLDFLTPDGGETLVHGYLSGSASASGAVSGSNSGGWTAVESTSGSWTYTGTAWADEQVRNSASYSGSSTLEAYGAYNGTVQVNQSGSDNYSDHPHVSYQLSGSSSSWTLASVTGSGSESGSTYWQAAGSGAYADWNASANVNFLMPGSTGALYQEEGLSGSAWAETSSAASFSGNWSDVLASGSIGVSGTGSVHVSNSDSAGYYGAGSFAVLGSFGTLYGVVTASESGAAKYNEKTAM